MMYIVSIICVSIILISFLYAYLKKLYISQIIVISNILIFAILFVSTYTVSINVYKDTITILGCKPSYIPSLKVYTVFTHMFLHDIRDIFHILLNMVLLILVGVPLEEKIGAKKFIFIYIFTGICGSIVNMIFTFIAPARNPNLIGIGASGAIFGVIGTYAGMYPRDTVAAPIGPFFLRKVPITLVAIVYISIETLLVHISPSDNVGHIVHIGGFLAGIFISPFMKMSLQSRKHEQMKLDKIEKLAKTENARRILTRIKTEDIDEIRRVWIEQLAEKLRCDRCNGKFYFKDNSIICEKCKRKISIY